MTATLVRYPVAPTITPLRGVLLDAASVTEGGDTWLDGSDLYETFSCIPMGAIAVQPCPATFIGTPVLASAAASAGGTLTAGAYRYKITAINGRGETVASNEVTGTTATTNLTLNPTWAAITGATGYKVYRTAIGGAVGTEKFLKSVGAVTTTTDTGSVALGTAVPPTTNTAVANQIKDFTGPSWIDGIVFATYGGYTCKQFGSLESSKAKIQEVYLAAESFAVEQALMDMMFGPSGAEDLTPSGGAVSPLVGLALLEGYMSTVYRGVPTIHVPRTIGTLLANNGSMITTGDTYLSKQGSKIASGGGYQVANVGPDGDATADGEFWLYATGEIALSRGEILNEQSLDQATNDQVILVERRYIASADCSIAAVRVEVA